VSGKLAAFVCTLLMVSPPLAVQASGPDTAIPEESPSLASYDPAIPAVDGMERTYIMPVIFNDSVEDYIDQFSNQDRAMFQRWLNRAAPYLPIVQEIFRSHGVPEELAYVAMIESGFKLQAVSPANAVGPWQFMTHTAKRYGLRIDCWVDERMDIVKSTHAAARHFKDLMRDFGSWPLALAAYNAGTGRVARAVNNTESADFWDLSVSSSLQWETKNYVPKFMAALLIARDPASYGFRAPEVLPVSFAEVAFPENVYLEDIARWANCPPDVIRELNPHLIRGVTPPWEKNCTVKIPADLKNALLRKMKRFRDGVTKLKAPVNGYLPAVSHPDEGFLRRLEAAVTQKAGHSYAGRSLLNGAPTSLPVPWASTSRYFETCQPDIRR
jgi:membrane-bound lytic murein transglycosylase D